MTTTGSIAPAPWFTAIDDDGSIIPGAKMYTYAAGTTTPLPTFSDLGLTVPNTNPVICDSAGRCLMFCSAATYKYTLRRPDGSLVRTQDNVPATFVQTGGTAESEVFFFGGDITAAILDTDYPIGTSYDKLHAGTSFYNVNSANLIGTFAIQAMLMGVGGAEVSLAIMNLSDGAPETPLAMINSVSATGELVTSAAITFAAPGSTKTYGIKVKVDLASGFAWAVRLVKLS